MRNIRRNSSDKKKVAGVRKKNAGSRKTDIGNCTETARCRKKVLMLASVASMIDQFNMPNIRLLKSLGCEVHVVCNFSGGNTCDAARIQTLKRELESLNVRWQQWDCPRNIGVLECATAFEQIWSLTACYQYDVIHCHSPVGGALARIVAHFRGIPVIYTAHGFHFYRNAPLKNWLLFYPVEKLLAHWTDVLVTVNGEDYAFAKRRLAAKNVYRIPGVGVDTKRFAIDENGQDGDIRQLFRKKHGIPQDAVLLLSVGELNEGKNHRYVLEALSRLCGKKHDGERCITFTHGKNSCVKDDGGICHADIYYMVCGRGELRGWLQRYADGLGIGSRFRMPGFMEHIEDAYAASDIFVFPSKREGMPVALMEAMAAGLPCVVTDIRGCRELISGQLEWGKIQNGGCRIPLGRPDELAAALNKLAVDRELREFCGRYNKRRIVRYDVMLVWERMRRIYGMYL